MRKFTSTKDVSVNELIWLLNEWEDNTLSRDEVLYLAEEIDELYPTGWPSYSRTDSRSVLFGVLDLLITLHIQPILKEDIPYIRNFLIQGQTQPTEAWKVMTTYWSHVDREQRLRDMYGHNKIL